MDKKLKKAKEKKLVVKKKTYTTPTLAVYGKLTELTAGGSGPITEVAAMNQSKNNRQ
jgi:hypothetical protein